MRVHHVNLIAGVDELITDAIKGAFLRMLRAFEVFNQYGDGVMVQYAVTLTDDQLLFLQCIFAFWVGINIREPDSKVRVGVVIGQLEDVVKSL